MYRSGEGSRGKGGAYKTLQHLPLGGKNEVLDVEGCFFERWPYS